MSVSKILISTSLIVFLGIDIFLLTLYHSNVLPHALTAIKERGMLLDILQGTTPSNNQTAIDNHTVALLNEWNAFENSNHTEERLVNYIQNAGSRPWDDLVLVTHLSPNKLHRLMVLTRWWNGPISIAIYCTEQSDIEEVIRVFNFRSDKLGNVTAHFLFEKNTTIGYPHNKLRNLAMHNAGADFVFPIDADFVTSPANSYQKMKRMFREHPEIVDRMKNMELFVVPVFEIFPKHQKDSELGMARERDLPQTRKRLIQMYKKENTARQWHYEPGHAASNYRKWLKAARNPDEMAYSITPEVNYEPYFIAHRPSLPSYWEEFRGYGKNKQSFIAECVFKGFSFNVLYGFWLSHLGHKSNRDEEGYQANKKIWKTTFVQHLQETYDTSKNAEWLTTAD